MALYNRTIIQQALNDALKKAKLDVRKEVAAKMNSKSIQPGHLASRGSIKITNRSDKDRYGAYKKWGLWGDNVAGSRKIVAKNTEGALSGGTGGDKQKAVKSILDGIKKPSDLKHKFNAKEMNEIIKKVEWKQKMNIRRQSALGDNGGTGGVAANLMRSRTDRNYVKKNTAADSSRLGVEGIEYGVTVGKKMSTQGLRGNQASGSAQAQGGLASVGQKLNSGAIAVGGQHGQKNTPNMPTNLNKPVRPMGFGLSR